MVTPSNTADVRDHEPDHSARAADLTPTSVTNAARQDLEPGPTTGGGRHWFRYTLPGAWVAVIFGCLSFTPSLVPRPGAFQGVVCGLAGAIGYGLGVLVARVWREFADRPAREPRPWSWRVFLIVAAVALLV